MSTRSRNIWLLAAAAAIIAAPFLIPGLGGEFKGVDDRGTEAIAEVRPGSEPWFKPLWKPPSGEVETGLFALQAAIGAGLLGYIMGRRASKKNVGDR